MVEVAAAALLVIVAAGLVRTLSADRRAATIVSRQLTEPVEPVAADPLSRFLRRYVWARVGLSLTSVGLLIAAAVMFGYPFYTNLYQRRLQNHLDNELVSPELEQAYRARRVATGDALTRIRIPAIDVDVVVVEGTTASALRAGAGHYPQTPLPCEDGNVGIAGHRTTYGRPFHNLDRLKPGDVITLTTPVGECTYKVAKPPFVVAPSQLGVVSPTPTPTLTLTTCHPKGSARQRLIIQAALEGPAAA